MTQPPSDWTAQIEAQAQILMAETGIPVSTDDPDLLVYGTSVLCTLAVVGLIVLSLWRGNR